MAGAWNWPEVRKKLEEVYSPIATEVWVTSDFYKNNSLMRHCEYIHSFTYLTENVVGVDPANITNRVIISLFIKNIYNKDIRRRVARAKAIITLTDAFRLAHHNLLKLKKYEGLV